MEIRNPLCGWTAKRDVKASQIGFQRAPCGIQVLEAAHGTLGEICRALIYASKVEGC